MPNLKFQVSAMLVAFEFSHHRGMYATFSFVYSQLCMGVQHGSESALHPTFSFMYSQLCMGHSMAASPHCEAYFDISIPRDRD